MLPTRGYAAKSSTTPLEPFNFYRREPGSHDVVIEILYCGVCHSDIHQARDEWGVAIYPMVPGHEIVGKITQVGTAVKKFKPGDTAGVGCMVDSCRQCLSCKEGVEQYCEKHVSWTYNGTEQDLKTRTLGGYSSHIVVDENFVLQISPTLSLAHVAPLLCAGITTYSPLRYANVSKNQRVGIVGLGGLGHMAVKFAVAMGAEVTVFSTSLSKENDARQLGAHRFVMTKDLKNFEPLKSQFDFILDTVAADHDLNLYLELLGREGKMTVVGIPENPLDLKPMTLILKRRMLLGSHIGGIRETQEMLDFCAEKKITADIEIIPIQKIEDAYMRTLKSDVKYRFVIDMKTL